MCYLWRLIDGGFRSVSHPLIQFAVQFKREELTWMFQGENYIWHSKVKLDVFSSLMLTIRKHVTMLRKTVLVVACRIKEEPFAIAAKRQTRKSNVTYQLRPKVAILNLPY